MRQRLRKFKDTFIQKYWHDPVWSKVISAGIIAILGAILTTIYVISKSIYDNIPFKTVANQIVEYFKLSTKVNNLIFWVCLFLLFWRVFLFVRSFTKALRIKMNSKSIDEEFISEPDELPTIRQNSTVFVSGRLARAFPGHRGLVWYEPKVAVKRLKIFFQDPIKFKSEGLHDCMPDPIWWFRAGSSMAIDEFRILSKTKVLIGWDEIEIKRIAVFTSNSYYKSFIYVEAKGEKQTGLYNYQPEDIQRHIDVFGYSSEEFGLLGKKAIRREQYDDGATVINGNVVDASDADLRVRFLSDYNFIIAAKQSPYNSQRFDKESKEYFDNIIQDKQTPENFFDFLETFKKQEY